mgnify:CR=1 FL=1
MFLSQKMKNLNLCVLKVAENQIYQDFRLMLVFEFLDHRGILILTFLIIGVVENIIHQKGHILHLTEHLFLPIVFDEDFLDWR